MTMLLPKLQKSVGCAVTIASLVSVGITADALAQTAAPETAANERESPGLEEVVVTAVNRTGKALDRIPGAVSVIGTADVSQNIAVTEDVTKVLEHSLPGYSPSREGRYTFGETLRGRRPLYLIDGIPQSTPLRDGSVGSYFVDLSMIERVEVINGPSATEGLGASGGIINYITKTPRKDGTEIAFDGKLSSQFHDNVVGWRTGLNFMHKEDAYDLFVGAAFVSRTVDYDGRGKLMGVDNFDTFGRDLMMKVGKNFGANDAQRIQLMINRFHYADNGDYVAVDGNRLLDLTNSGKPGQPLGTPQNQIMNQESLEYRHDDLLGGKLLIQAFRDDQSALNPASIDSTKQDVRLAPIGTLVDQSEITADKHGVRSIFVRPDLFIKGLEADVGVDYLHDETAQGLAMTHRVWVPPLKYSSIAPFGQLEYDFGPVTVRGGLRHESADLRTDDFTTIAPANTFVRGGKLSFSKNLYNVGGIYRIAGGWSVYAAYSEGFGIPDVGRALRGINVPNQSLETRGNLTPLLVKNREAGINWRTSRASVGASVYRSYAPLGSSLAFDPATQQAVVSRTPTRVTGFEFIAEARFMDSINFTALYSRTVGKTALGNDLPLNIDMTADQIPPQKIVGAFNWGFVPGAHLSLTATSYLDRHVNEGVTSLSGAKLEESFQGYPLVDLSMRYETERFGNWTLAVENLLDKYYIQYISSSSINQIPTGPSAYYLSGRGRAVSLSTSFKF
jgi:iron complex outermembrane receptor protein